MANMSKKKVKEELQRLGIPVTTDDYKELCGMLKDATAISPATEADLIGDTEESPVFIHLESRIKKRNIFLADEVRAKRDKAILDAEINKQKYKGKIASITTKKYIEVSAEGEWVTEFDIELKD